MYDFKALAIASIEKRKTGRIQGTRKTYKTEHKDCEKKSVLKIEPLDCVIA